MRTRGGFGGEYVGLLVELKEEETEIWGFFFFS